MIKKIILPLLAVLLLGSCANKFSLVKRKYNKGFYVSRSHSSNTNPTDTERKAVVKNNPSAAAKEQVAEQPVKALEQVAQVNEPKTGEQNPAGLAKTMQPKKETKPVSASAKKMVDYKHPVKALPKAEAVKSGKGEKGGMLIVMIILCFLSFLNLIAIYIHDDKKLTLNFLITLLLDFTLIGGIIFSLLVVLDIIDLA